MDDNGEICLFDSFIVLGFALMIMSTLIHNDYAASIIVGNLVFQNLKRYDIIQNCIKFFFA